MDLLDDLLEEFVLFWLEVEMIGKLPSRPSTHVYFLPLSSHPSLPSHPNQTVTCCSTAHDHLIVELLKAPSVVEWKMEGLSSAEEASLEALLEMESVNFRGLR